MIPVLDFDTYRQGDSAAFVEAWGRACRETGFVVLTGHGIDPGLVRRAFEVSAAFFALPEAEKARLSIGLNPHNRGYLTLGEEFLDESSGLKDQKEAFNIGLDLEPTDPRVQAGEPFRGVNVWPDLDGFRDAMLAYFDAVLDLGRDLHRAIAEDLGVDREFFTPHLTEPLATLRLLRYPGGAGGSEAIGAGAHTDYGSITLLATDGVPGLQVKPRGGDWMDVPSVDGAFIVNIADLLMRWTNDIYVSTPHRVLVPPRVRQSLAFFIDPNPDSVISPLPGTGEPKYEPVSGADYLSSRLNATYDHSFGS